MYTRGFMIFIMVIRFQRIRSHPERLGSYSLGPPLNNKALEGFTVIRLCYSDHFLQLCFYDYTKKALHITCRKVKTHNTLVTTKSPFSLASKIYIKHVECSRHVKRSPALHEFVTVSPDPRV